MKKPLPKWAYPLIPLGLPLWAVMIAAFIVFYLCIFTLGAIVAGSVGAICFVLNREQPEWSTFLWDIAVEY